MASEQKCVTMDSCDYCLDRHIQEAHGRVAEAIVLEVEEAVPGKRKRARTRKLKTSDSKVAKYTQTYPQILEPAGWYLLELDFEYLHKDAVFKLDVKYPKLEQFILSKLRELNPNCLYDDFSEKSLEVRSAFIFLSLSKLYPVTHLTTVKDCQWRPNRSEIRDGFLLQIKAYADLKDILEARRKNRQKHKLTNQPLPVMVKTTSNDRQGNETVSYRCFVNFDSCEYEVETPLKLMDVTFKTYHALHAFYPAESDALWLFLQKAVYKFTEKWDHYNDTTERLVKEYSRFEIRN